MRSLSLLSSSVLLLASTLNLATASPYASKVELRKYYSRAHSLGENYQFDPREWHSLNATSMRSREDETPAKRSPKHHDDSKDEKPEKGSKDDSGDGGVGDSVGHLIHGVWNGLKAIGSPSDTKITWYTGHDLLNPSCWPNSKWHPSDDSMTCALTLDGWDAQPKCFKFMQLCNGPTKCIFVRKVDTCAGCAPGSKHVDLTKGAFTKLASIDEGVLNVQMREATDPDNWLEDLWGPQN